MLWLLAVAAAHPLCDPPGEPSLRALGDALGGVAAWNGTGGVEIAICAPTLPTLCGGANATACRRGTDEPLGFPTGWTWRTAAETGGGPGSYGILWQRSTAACMPSKHNIELTFANGTAGMVVLADSLCSTHLLISSPLAFLPEPAAGPTSTGAATGTGGAAGAGGTTAGAVPPPSAPGDGGDGDIGLALGVGIGGGGAMLCALLAASTVALVVVASAAVLFAVACAAALSALCVVLCGTTPAAILIYAGGRPAEREERYVRPLGPEDTLVLGPRIGEGSFGVVHRGTYNGGVVAIKVVRMGQSRDVVLDEIATMGRVGPFPYVVHLLTYRIDEAANEAHLVLDWCEGGPLRKAGSTEERRWAWTVHILTALRHIHCAGILHRDIALRNILLDDRGHARICDFGLSRRACGRHLTEADTGPLRWMAPEAVLRGESSRASDLYMVGATLWELWADDVPWPQYERHDVIRAAERGERLGPTGNPAADALIDALTQPDPARRPTVEEALAAAVAAYQSRWGEQVVDDGVFDFNTETDSSDLTLKLSLEIKTS